MPGAEDVPKNHAIKMLPRTGFEPVTYGLLLYSQLQSTALPTELSRVVYRCRRQVQIKCQRELSQNDLEFWKANSQSIATANCPGDVAQMVERSLSM